MLKLEQPIRVEMQDTQAGAMAYDFVFQVKPLPGRVIEESNQAGGLQNIDDLLTPDFIAEHIVGWESVAFEDDEAGAMECNPENVKAILDRFGFMYAVFGEALYRSIFEGIRKNSLTSSGGTSTAGGGSAKGAKGTKKRKRK